MYKFLALALIGVAGLLAGVTVAGGTPPAGGPPGQGECQHGNSGKDCKPDPQPGHGQDCDEHGPKNGGVNEDHCGPVDTTPTDTTPTTPTDTTSTVPTDTTPTTPGPRCPPGMTPTAGKDGQPGNDECEFPKPPEAPPATATTTVAAVPAAVPPVTTTVTSSTPPVTQPPAKPKAAPKAKQPKPDNPPKVVKVEKKPNGVVKITTSDGKTHTGIMGSG